MSTLPQVGEIRDRKVVYRAQDGSSLEWHLIPDNENEPPDPRGIWKPRQIADDGVTILQEPKWAPLPGSQHLFLTCPVFEVLYHGNRGSAKSQALLMDYAKGVGRGWGERWRGILFRQNLGDLDDTVLKIERFFKPLYGDRFRFLYSKADYRAVWDTGEALLLRHLRDETDYKDYHGHEYPWIGFEELTQWPDDVAYRKMQSCCRMTGIPASECRIRASTNPGEAGHAWVKKRFRLPDGTNKVILAPGEMPRVAIKGELRENFLLLHAQPTYETIITQAATTPMQKRAWLTGDWDITAGGMIDDVWRSDVHVIPAFPANMIPARWIISRSYDHGQAKPHACGWWLESNGEPIIIGNKLVGAVRGDRILWAEWYGTSGGSNEGVRMAATSIAQGIIDREKELGIHGRVRFGVADNEIYSKDSRGTARSPADDMADRGVFWDPADKSSGSRHRGWERMRTMLQGAIPNRDGSRESPGLFVTDRCRNWLALVPSMPRDQKDPDDVPATYEDHLADMTRYALTWDMPAMSRTTF